MSVSFPPLRSYAEVARGLPPLPAAPPPVEPAILSPRESPSIVNPDAMRLAGQLKGSLQPETVCKILCKYLAKGKTPEEIAQYLIRDRSFVSALLEIPLKDLQASAKDFSPLQLSESIRQLYLFALSTTELITTIRTYENNWHNERTRLFEISRPGHWDLIVGGHCKSWKQVEAFFRAGIALRPKKDRELLIENIKQFRSWMTDLKELERALSLDKNNLLFLSKNCFCDNGRRMFPRCNWKLPSLFQQLDICREQFPCRELLIALGRRSRQCQELLDSIHPPRAEETELDRFCFTNDRVIYSAGLELLSELAKSPEATEEFLYGYCDEHFGLDLNEWMHLIISALPEIKLLPLSKSIYKIDEDRRGRFLSDYLVRQLDLPQDLASFKKRFEFQEGETP